MPKKDPTVDALNSLAGLRDRPEDERRKAIKIHLRNKSSWVVAKAAKLAGDSRDEAAIPELVVAFHRLIAERGKHDKGCTAITEVAAALYALDHHDAEVWLAGIAYVQMEGSFGPPADTAVQLRSHCAMGLAQTHYSGAAIAIVKLLADPESGARSGAVRALASLSGDAASLLLRYKVLIGDRDPDVIAECFAGLLAVDADASLEFVAEYADSGDPEIGEAAILALGACRAPAAIEWLKEKWDRTVAGPIRKTLLLALSTARQEIAIEFLLKLLAEENPATMKDVLDALRIYQHDERIWSRVTAIVDQRREK
jgi:hypothetical protein